MSRGIGWVVEFGRVGWDGMGLLQVDVIGPLPENADAAMLRKRKDKGDEPVFFQATQSELSCRAGIGAWTKTTNNLGWLQMLAAVVNSVLIVWWLVADLRMKTPTKRVASVGQEAPEDFAASCVDGPSTSDDAPPSPLPTEISEMGDLVGNSRPWTSTTTGHTSDPQPKEPPSPRAPVTAPASPRALTTSSQRRFRVQGELTQWEPADCLQPD